ncbi:hypothetical protein [Thiohalocapsa sp. ML1]|jgi:hypothetical protein|nr:hypothetical protein [Thiohalocapsa sp. ML1]
MTRTTLIVGSLLLAGLFISPSAPAGAARPFAVLSGHPAATNAS